MGFFPAMEITNVDCLFCTCQARYFVEEVKEKTGREIDVSDWALEFVEDLPEQENG